MCELTEDTLRERVSGEHMVHRLRDWTDGDTVFAVTHFTDKDRGAVGKTFREGSGHGEGAEKEAREFFNSGFPPGHVTAAILFRATVRDPRTEPRDPNDPGEPPLKFATFSDVEILEWEDHTGDGDE